MKRFSNPYCLVPWAIFVAVLFFFPLGSAQAYVGPGLGAGAIAVVVGVVGSVFLALFAILWYPFKRMRKKRKAAQAEAQKKEE